jgi:hypothetical protein
VGEFTLQGKEMTGQFKRYCSPFHGVQRAVLPCRPPGKQPIFVENEEKPVENARAEQAELAYFYISISISSQ